jgi:hypothetical protein
VRLAVSEGETARLSGQMSTTRMLGDKRGLCKGFREPVFEAGSLHGNCGAGSVGFKSEGLLLSGDRGGTLQRIELAGAKPCSQLAKRNEPMRRFIPKHEPDARQALAQREPADIRQLRMMAKHKRQPVRGNSAAQVVDMVHADIGGEPAQYGWQIVMRAAVERRARKTPIPGFRPERVLELMLHIEQPHTDRPGEDGNR